MEVGYVIYSGCDHDGYFHHNDVVYRLYEDAENSLNSIIEALNAKTENSRKELDLEGHYFDNSIFYLEATHKFKNGYGERFFIDSVEIR